MTKRTLATISRKLTELEKAEEKAAECEASPDDLKLLESVLSRITRQQITARLNAIDAERQFLQSILRAGWYRWREEERQKANRPA